MQLSLVHSPRLFPRYADWAPKGRLGLQGAGGLAPARKGAPGATGAPTPLGYLRGRTPSKGSLKTPVFGRSRVLIVVLDSLNGAKFASKCVCVFEILQRLGLLPKVLPGRELNGAKNVRGPKFITRFETLAEIR